MTFLHTILVLILSLFFLAAVFAAIVKGRIRARYALLWFGIGILALFSPLLYAFCEYLFAVWHFPTPSVMLLLCAVVALALICLQLTTVASRSFREQKNLAQHCALLEQRLEVLESMPHKNNQGGSK